MSKSTGFFRPEHDIDNFTGTDRNAVSLSTHASAMAASAWLNQHSMLYLQSGRSPLLAGRVPNVYAEIARSGSNTALGEQSNMWCIARSGYNDVHIFTYADKEWSARCPTMTPTGR
jgi:hypothetical protein